MYFPHPVLEYSLNLFIIYTIFQFSIIFQDDISQRMTFYDLQQNLSSSTCKSLFEENLCRMNPPISRDKCNEWIICMSHKNRKSQIIIIFEILGETLNRFVAELSLSALAFILAIIYIIIKPLLFHLRSKMNHIDSSNLEDMFSKFYEFEEKPLVIEK